MSRLPPMLSALFFVTLTSGAAFGQEGAPPPPPPAEGEGQPPPPPPPDEQGAAQPPPPAPPEPQEAPPPPSWTQVYSTGQWVYAPEYGWIWVQNGTGSVAIDGVPYAYLYTPAYGWTWYVSPWGWGPYHLGGWVRHPWRPQGWRGTWVAPRPVVGRLRVPPHRAPPRVAPRVEARPEQRAEPRPAPRREEPRREERR